MSLSGGLRQRQKKSRTIEYLDVVPLVDVVFVLLFFFLLTYNINRPEGFNLAMPRASKVGKVKDAGLRVIIPVSGPFRVGDRRLNEDSLKAFLINKLAEDNNLVVHLVADRRASSQRLVTALEVTTSVGVKNALLRTEQGEP